MDGSVCSPHRITAFVFCSRGLKVYQQLKSMDDFQHNTMAVLYCVHQWTEKFKSGRTSVKDSERE